MMGENPKRAPKICPNWIELSRELSHRTRKKTIYCPYCGEELKEWVPKVEKLSGEAKSTYIIFNNHFQRKSTKNAAQLAKLLGL